MREFNVTGICVPNMHYMVDISEKIEQIFRLVKTGKYFTINRGRQFGKTTTIGMLEKRLVGEPCRTMVGEPCRTMVGEPCRTMPDDYICASISFQYSDDEMFANEQGFSQGLLDSIHRALSVSNREEAKLWLDESVTSLKKLDYFITERCTGKKIVLIIDEADEASNNSLFVRFLKMLRDKFLFRNTGKDYTFLSVILAGVYDIRNLKQKMVLAGNYTPSSGESVMNSPWNIAVDFDIDMSFSAREIETMLVEYENDRQTGMNIPEIAREIRIYTSGYPYLVSRICQLIENKLKRNWTLEGVREAVKLILKENSTLFDDMVKKIEENGDLKNLLYNLTVGGKIISFNAHDPVIKFGLMFSFIAEGKENKLVIHNKIFEIAITEYFISRNTTSPEHRNIRDARISEIVADGVFDMELCLTKFKQHYAEIYTAEDAGFLERDGKLIFLTYLKPLINGYGFYHFEPETRDNGKMDLVIDYLKQQFILEMKLWHGNSRHEDAYRQLAAYLTSKNADCGYLLTFDFRREGDSRFSENKWIEYGGKRIFDVVLRVGRECRIASPVPGSL